MSEKDGNEQFSAFWRWIQCGKLATAQGSPILRQILAMLIIFKIIQVHWKFSSDDLETDLVDLETVQWANLLKLRLIDFCYLAVTPTK